MNIENNDINQDNIIYDRTSTLFNDQPEFKPSNTPYTQLGNETLNANILWYQVINEILLHYTQEQLVDEAGITPINLRKILNQNYRKLNFKTGAQLLSIHCRFYPEQY